MDEFESERKAYGELALAEGEYENQKGVFRLYDPERDNPVEVDNVVIEDGFIYGTFFRETTTIYINTG